MVAIQSRFIGPTDYRGARYVAEVMEPQVDGSGNKRRKRTVGGRHAGADAQ